MADAKTTGVIHRLILDLFMERAKGKNGHDLTEAVVEMKEYLEELQALIDITEPNLSELFCEHVMTNAMWNAFLTPRGDLN